MDIYKGNLKESWGTAGDMHCFSFVSRIMKGNSFLGSVTTSDPFISGGIRVST